MTTQQLKPLKHILALLVLLVALSPHMLGQRNTQYTQFMPNKLWINPAYAGSHNLGVITAIAREQWVGLNGAPSSQGINFHTPLANNRIGLGLNFSLDEIGPTNNLFISTQYAYRIPLSRGTLAFGLNAAVNSNMINFTELSGLQAQTFGQNNPEMDRTTRFNFGSGVYYQSDKFFGGLSVPFLLNHRLQYLDDDQNITYSEQERSFYGMVGFAFKISDKITAKPTLLAKYDNNSPMDFDLHGSLIFMDRLWTGLTYRLGTGEIYTSESIDLIVQYQFTNALRMGMAYDFTLTDVRRSQDGSFELLLQYAFEIKYKKKDETSEKITNPRYF